MCGIFGFVSVNGGKLDLKRIKTIAAITMSRGPHAFGFAWIDRRGTIKMFKRAGRIVDHLGMLSMAADATMLVGHCRWATHGDPEININNHPHPADGGWVVHNGVVRDHRRLVRMFGLHPVSSCDSEVLCQLIELGTGPPIDRCSDAVKTTDESPLALLGLWKPDHLVAVRRGNPLHIGMTKNGDYLASLPAGLPGDVFPLMDRHAIEYTTEGLIHVTAL